MNGMKNFSQIRVLGFRLLGMAAVWSCCCTSCSKDPTAQIGGGSSAHLAFSVDEGGAWTSPRSRSAADTTARITIFLLEGTQPGDSLFLHAAVADRPDSTLVTRGTCIDNASFYDAFGVLAFVYTGAWSDDLTPDYMYDVEITKASGWTASEYNWPGKGRMIRFFAYAPYHGTGIQLSEKQTPGAPTITYTTPADVAQQQDLVAAAPAEMDGAPAPEKSAALNFSHILTAIRFSVGDDMMAGRITKITLKDVYGKAVYDMGTGTWSGFSTPESFSQTLSEDVDGTPDVEITAPEATFLMIPQTLPQGATIEIAYTDQLTGTSRTLTAGIGNSVWPQGQTVTYRISTSSISITPTFTVTPPDDFTYEGGTLTYKVDSRGVVSRPGDPDKSVPLPWTAEFVEDDGAGGYRVIEQPEWITGFTLSGDGAAAAQSFNVTIAAQDGITSNPHNDILQQAQDINTTSGHTPYNLSNATGAATVENTANCYVINAPGKYYLPLVYGNAIKDGQTNESAYTSSASGAYVLQNFINHTGNAITDPYIYNNADCTPDNATLVWQDEKDLVTNVTLSGNNLTFEVPQASIRQGNAIVAVRNAANQIMWSWHIWVTDYVPGLEPTVEMTYDPTKTQRDKVVTNYQNVQYTFMPVNIGWCDGETTTYEGRNVKVRFTQAETKETQVIEVVQIWYSSAIGGNAPYYQWGRKDPMLPVIIDPSNLTDKPCYATSNYKFQIATGQVSIGKSISNPNLFYNYGSKAPEDWCSTHYTNLWSADNTTTTANDNVVIKTIYDPSPVGYHLPTTNVFTGVTYNGEAVSGNYFGSRYNSPYTSFTDIATNLGWLFYCNKMNGAGQYDTQGGVIFFPAIGCRHLSTGQIYYGGKIAYSWTAIPFNTAHGYTSYFHTTGIEPYADSRRSYAIAVRPVREK